MESKKVRYGRNHGLRKRGIAAGHVRVVDYVSSRISVKVSCSLALPSPDSSSVCANSLRLLFCSTQVSSPKIKYNLIFLYTYVLLKNVESSIKQVLVTTPHETPTIRTLAPHHENYTSSTNQTRRTLLEKQGRAHKRCTPVDPTVDVQEWDDQHGLTYSNYVRTQDVTLKTCRRRWMIGRNGERGSGISALAARHDDDDTIQQ